MSKIPVSRGEVPQVEDGVYPATCTAVKDDFIENAQFGSGDVVRLSLRLDDVVDENGEVIVLDAIANAKVSAKSKLVRWAGALGVPVDLDLDDFETENLVGHKCLVTVVHREGSDWPRVDDLTAMPKARGGRPAAPVGQPEAYFPDGFWRDVKSQGFDREDVKRAVDGNLADLQQMDEGQLRDLITLLDKPPIEPEDVPFEEPAKAPARAR